MTGTAAVASFVGAARSFRVATADAASWSPGQRRTALVELERVGALLAGARADLIRAEEAALSWVAPGVRSLGDRVGRDTGIGTGAGAALVRQADAWGQVPLLADAAEAGTITTGHVEAVGRVARQASPEVRDVLTSERVQQRLVQLAKGMDVPAFSKELARKVATLDPDEPDRALERQRRNRYLRLVDTGEGTRITGQVDHQCGRRLRLAVEAASSRPAEDDPRTAVQRDVDALIDVADVFLSFKDTGSGAAVRPHVSLVMSVETLAELRAAQADRAAPVGGDAAAARRVDAGDGAAGTAFRVVGADVGSASGATGGCAGEGDSAPRAGEARAPFHTTGTGCAEAPPARPLFFSGPVDPVTDEDGAVVPLSEVARILCDCAITRIALGEDGEPLELGRQARLFTGQQRRVVLARDRGCAWEGCTIPARWCEIHHIWWWDRDNGPTDVDNGVALCRFHHQEVHRRDLHLIRYAADPPVAFDWVAVGGEGRRDDPGGGGIGAGGNGVSGNGTGRIDAGGHGVGGTYASGNGTRGNGTGGNGAGEHRSGETDVGEPARRQRRRRRFDPGRATVRYVIRTRDGTVVAGGMGRVGRRTPDADSEVDGDRHAATDPGAGTNLGTVPWVGTGTGPDAVPSENPREEPGGSPDSGRRTIGGSAPRQDALPLGA